MTEKKKPARKKKEEVVEFQDPTSIGKMEPSKYWEWRCTIEELKTAKLNEKLAVYKKDLLTKELIIKQLELKNHAQIESKIYQEKIAAQKEYERFKLSLEEDLGFDLKDCVIDDITFEVKKLD
jgi:RecG-like helicase